ncbi:hypothetical protein LshimejAT787_1403140 [Lyophyllum shimeji]|uniref:Uncharacterized protein n=1 Tax=Lyophyllum shimeji TaxID=47721 RepID=A0A9P3PYY7_LYOSH|nr:hypothetical protein LshimejAT787_1403140 [Lyophyllum shimeji]
MLAPHCSRTACALNEHVLEEIFSILCDTSHATLRSLLLTNSLFNRLARPLLYRYIALNIATANFMVEVQSWLADPAKAQILQAIRHIRIEKIYVGYTTQPAHDPSVKLVGKVQDLTKRRSRSPPPRDTAEEWSALATLVARTTQLRSLTFAVGEAVPLVLLRAIHDYPTPLHLHLAQWTRPSDAAPHDDPAELELARSPALRSLHAVIYNPQRSHRDLRVPAFWRIVRAAPNLQSVELEIGDGGCVVRRETADQVARWEALALAFEHPEHRAPSQRAPGIRKLKIGAAELAGWRGGDLSRVTHLECVGDLTLHALRSFTSLTHVTLESCEDVDEVLAACPPLASLAITGWTHGVQLDTILAYHAHTLDALGLHEAERYDRDNPRETLSIAALCRIRDACRRLAELSIDLNIQENPPPEHLSTDDHQDVYATLATIPRLRRLQLNYNLGISSYSGGSGRAPSRHRRSASPAPADHAQVPLADARFVEAVWGAVNRGRGASPIRELRVAQGEARRRTGVGYPAGWVKWEQRRHQWFKAAPSERDDEPDGIGVLTWLTKRKSLNCRQLRGLREETFEVLGATYISRRYTS